VISGHAPGADTLGEEYATDMCLPLEVYPARWDLYGNSAGRLRNELMLGKAEAVLAVWDGESPGTRHMIRIAEREKIPVHVYRVYTIREQKEKVNNGR